MTFKVIAFAAFLFATKYLQKKTLLELKEQFFLFLLKFAKEKRRWKLI